MKKFLSSVMVAIFFVLAGLPLVAANVGDASHACCRSHGVHHCEDANDGGTHELVSACPHHAGAIFFGSAAGRVERHRVTVRLATAFIEREFHTSAKYRAAELPTGRAPPQSSL